MLRCLSNLLAEEMEGCNMQVQDERLLVALFTFMQYFLNHHLFIVQECLWLLNNLTGEFLLHYGWSPSLTGKLLHLSAKNPAGITNNGSSLDLLQISLEIHIFTTSEGIKLQRDLESEPVILQVAFKLGLESHA